ncbi:MAG: ABC transporter ATP-binding protein [Eubacteriales bacterium]|nr:ABC transporter ATP-binding protein [Eubacteriales bacterium]
MLKVKGLTKAYGKVIANNNLSFEIPAQSVNLLLGPNGAGKSTLIMCILGLLRCSGDVTIAGHDKASIEAKRIVGYMPEIPQLYPLLTVAEHLEFVSRIYRLEDWQRRAEELLERFDLKDKKHKLGAQLSKGMQQKLSLISAVIAQPKLLLVDEPLIGLDPPAIREAKKLFHELAEAGTTLVISTHILDTMGDLWDRSLIMQDGYLKAIVERDYLDARGLSLDEFFLEVTNKKAEAEPAEEQLQTAPEKEYRGGGSDV